MPNRPPIPPRLRVSSFLPLSSHSPSSHTAHRTSYFFLLTSYFLRRAETASSAKPIYRAPRARFPVKINQPASSPFALLPSPFINRTSSFLLRTSSTALLPSYFFLLTSSISCSLPRTESDTGRWKTTNSRQGAQGGEEKLRWVRRLLQRFARNPGNNPEQPGMQPQTTFRSRTKPDKICFPGFAKCVR